MPADPLEWITAPLALLALIISVLSLWYSSLKGPDMVLCEKPCFVLEEIPREAFDHYVPHTLSSETRLLLVNNGTVSGVLRLNISFEPTIELKPFFDKATFSFTLGPGHHEGTMPPISISEKESCMIAIRLSVEFVNWKKYFAHTHKTTPITTTDDCSDCGKQSIYLQEITSRNWFLNPDCAFDIAGASVPFPHSTE
jgi:hypothetical protein